MAPAKKPLYLDNETLPTHFQVAENQDASIGFEGCKGERVIEVKAYRSVGFEVQGFKPNIRLEAPGGLGCFRVYGLGFKVGVWVSSFGPKP